MISFVCGEASKPLSKERSGRLYFKQLPVSFESFAEWMLVTKNLTDGPLGLLLTHMNRSFYLCYSKNRKLLHDSSKQRSSMMSFTCLRSTLCSFFVFGSILVKSSTRWRKLPAMPREQRINVRCLFFHSLDAGSGSLNAWRPSSSPASLTSPSFESFSLSYSSSAVVAMFSCFYCLSSRLVSLACESSDSLLLSSALDEASFDLLSFLNAEAIIDFINS